MTSSVLFRSTAMLALAFSFAVPAGAQSIVGRGKTGPVPNPVPLIRLALPGEVQSVGDDMFIAGQPTENARDSARGLTMIGPAHAGRNGTGRVRRGSFGHELDTFAAAMASADGKVLRTARSRGGRAIFGRRT